MLSRVASSDVSLNRDSCSNLASKKTGSLLGQEATGQSLDLRYGMKCKVKLTTGTCPTAMSLDSDGSCQQALH